MDRAKLGEARRLLEQKRRGARQEPKADGANKRGPEVSPSGRQDRDASQSPSGKELRDSPLEPEIAPQSREKRSMKRRIMEALELPQDVVLDVPRIMLIGNFQLAVENHRGLVEYTSERVSIGVARGQLSISGQGLVIGIISGEEITVLGEISSISFDD